jgi:hypothetical protein
VLFTDLEKRPVVLAFDQAHGSSDGGAILLSAANQRYNDGLDRVNEPPVCRMAPARQGRSSN